MDKGAATAEGGTPAPRGDITYYKIPKKGINLLVNKLDALSLEFMKMLQTFHFALIECLYCGRRVADVYY